MIVRTLWLDADGLAWLHERDEEEGKFGLKLLGEPRAELYEVVPGELWKELERLIADHEDAVRYGKACRQEDEATYRRQRL